MERERDMTKLTALFAIWRTDLKIYKKKKKYKIANKWQFKEEALPPWNWRPIFYIIISSGEQ
jgi:hypothetical protein